MEGQTVESVLAEQLPFWAALPEEERRYLSGCSFFRSARRGELVHGGGAECTGAILVRSGCLRCYMLSEDGREITLYRLGTGEICMLSASCVLRAITFDVEVTAEEDSECLVIRGNALAALADRNPDVKIFALETAVGRFSDVMWVMQQILFMSFDRRLAIFLLDETAKTGEDTVRLTHEAIAKYMGSAREVVSRMLKYFAEEGLVSTSRGGIRLLDRPRLRKMTEGK